MNEFNKPIVLFEKELEWITTGSDYYKYRLVARPTEYGFMGVDYETEKLDGHDAMGVERWIKTESTEGSLVIAAIGQFLLDNHFKSIVKTSDLTPEELIEVERLEAKEQQIDCPDCNGEGLFLTSNPSKTYKSKCLYCNGNGII